jgi:hypothetical protein
MLGLPGRTEAASYYYLYIDRISNPDIVRELETQKDDLLKFLTGIPPGKSVHRYAPDKWTIGELLNHITDTERVLLFRAFWFGRGFESPLPSFDQDVGASGAAAGSIAWESHIEEFRAVRLSAVALFRNLPAGAWMRGGVASGNPVTVRALAYIIAGHAAHHCAILRERYF